MSLILPLAYLLSEGERITGRLGGGTGFRVCYSPSGSERTRR